MTLSTPARRIALVAALMAAWVTGSVLGATEPARTASAGPLLQVEPAHAGFVPALDGSEPIFVLVIGSDARPDQAVESQRADSLHIVAINPAEHRATIVGIPRDSYVSVPGRGQDKINAALFLGGPDLVVETVEELTGLTMDYWAMTGFAGFTTMVDDVGGLVVNVPFAMHDLSSGGEFQLGRQRLDRNQALAFARERKTLPSGDLGRSENHGVLMVSALAQFKHEFLRDPTRMFEWLGAFMRNGENTAGLDNLVDLAFTATTINPNKVVNAVLPGAATMIGGLSIVSLDQDVVTRISNDLEDDGLLKRPNIPPSPNAQLTGEA